MLCKLKCRGRSLHNFQCTSAKRRTSTLRHVAEAFPPATQGTILNSYRVIGIATNTSMVLNCALVTGFSLTSYPGPMCCTPSMTLKKRRTRKLQWRRKHWALWAMFKINYYRLTVSLLRFFYDLKNTSYTYRFHPHWWGIYARVIHDYHGHREAKIELSQVLDTSWIKTAY